ncbi:MAG TPA: cytochrome c maturation protein CcmE [Alphaproteobacteria bacterium]|nr:cytochrome c maturation protein CcmE [Alphaproteobacteria bacterium]
MAAKSLSSAKQRRRKRLVIALGALLALGGATALVLTAFQDSLVFFYSPSELAAKPPPEGRRVRVGGLVEDGSVQKSGLDVRFRITDTARSIAVNYRGQLPDLFREGQGVVAQGTLASDGSFTANEVLAKHDETYMPPEVAKALKDSGRWKEGEAPPTHPGEAKP